MSLITRWLNAPWIITFLWFYIYFEDDINQRLAKRKDKTQVITEQRETKIEKENKALSKENKVWCIEKICKNETDAMAYCDTMNKDLPYRLYRYEEYELE